MSLRNIFENTPITGFGCCEDGKLVLTHNYSNGGKSDKCGNHLP